MNNILKNAVQIAIEEDLLSYEPQVAISKIASAFNSNLVMLFSFDLENHNLEMVDSSITCVSDETAKLLDDYLPSVIHDNHNSALILLDWAKIKSTISSLTTDIEVLLLPLQYQQEVVGALLIGVNKSVSIITDPDASWLATMLSNLLGAYIVYQIQSGYNESEDNNFGSSEPKILEYTSRSGSSKQMDADRNFFRQFIHEFDRASRYKFSLSLICIDIDHFKEINEVYGSNQGQTIMDNIYRFLAEHSRKIDLVGRYGGEKFILVLCDTPLQQATRFAERLRQQFENTVFFIDEGISFIKLTVSMGVSALKEHMPESPAQMIEFGDIAVYMAKKSGRNKVISYSDIIHNKVKGEGKA